MIGFYNPDAQLLPGSDQLDKVLNEYLEGAIAKGEYGPGVELAQPFTVINPEAALYKEGETRKEHETEGSKKERAKAAVQVHGNLRVTTTFTRPKRATSHRQADDRSLLTLSIGWRPLIDSGRPAERRGAPRALAPARSSPLAQALLSAVLLEDPQHRRGRRHQPGPRGRGRDHLAHRRGGGELAGRRCPRARSKAPCCGISATPTPAATSPWTVW